MHRTPGIPGFCAYFSVPCDKASQARSPYGAPAPGLPQVAESARQMVALEPGSRGENVIWAPEVTWAEVSAADGAEQALTFGDGIDDMSPWMAATAEFMYALASALQAPSAPRMR